MQEKVKEKRKGKGGGGMGGNGGEMEKVRKNGAEMGK